MTTKSASKKAPSLRDELKNTLTVRRGRLEEIKAALKLEFFGIDGVIDKIIDSVKTWYIMPHVINRPVIINLWGLTGVGKTALVRSLVKKLQYQGKFVEIQMDGISNGSGYSYDSIAKILQASSIEEGEPGIVLLDEFQRFRTIDQDGDDVEIKRFQDVWMLLSDGKFACDYAFLKTLEEQITSDEYYAQSNEDTPREKKLKAKQKFKMSPYEARNFKRLLRMRESIPEIMAMDSGVVQRLAREALENNDFDVIDYSKTLVFVCGNLDEAFTMSGDVDDCDTDADTFYKQSLKISVIEIKNSLTGRFKSEQIARLGNNHIIYPSLSKDAYQKIIHNTCAEYVRECSSKYGINLNLSQEVYDQIYANSVYPAQGTRPVFTSVGKMFGSPLPEVLLWAIESGYVDINVSINAAASEIVFYWGAATKRIKIDFDIKERKARNTDDFNAMVAVHEFGHAITHAVLFREAPLEVAVNLARYKGGYMVSDDETRDMNRVALLNRITVLLGGIAAEEVVFGNDLRSSGGGSDIQHATILTTSYVRRLGLSKHMSNVSMGQPDIAHTGVHSTNDAVEKLMRDSFNKAKKLLKKHKAFLIKGSKHLLKVSKLTPEQFTTLAKGSLPPLTGNETSYAEKLKTA